ncbi:PREDICTED: uncharacterized protein LOC109233740 [Nicotiana attenuata]|uniref:uncharacterized protein LOC109233740 n=1 Tax=Nicotiana attenuata TaxID=49451 RepID=UPI000904A2F0|nr:PREDICTED: uncharacterized protein LOC109233740 [Nicotiana attenuata]
MVLESIYDLEFPDTSHFRSGRGFHGRRLPCHQVTNFLDLPALGRRQPPYMVLRLCGDLCFWYPLAQSRSSFSWEYGMGYFSAVAPGIRTLARGIFSTPSYPDKAGTPYVLEPITIFRLTYAEAIYSLLLDHSLSTSKIRGQGYDGASNMKGEINGLKTLIMKDSSSAYYIHCFAHQLQLTLVAIAKKHLDVEEFFDHVTNMLNVVGGSFKRRDLLHHHQAEELEQLLESGEVITGQGLNQECGLQRPGDTLWGSHFKTLDNFIAIFSSIVRMLKLIEYDGSTSHERNQADYLLGKIRTFKFIFVLHLMVKVLAMSNEMSKILQKKDQDIVNVVVFLDITKKRLQDMRETGWKSLLDDVSSFCDGHDILIPKMDESYFPEKSKRKSNVCYSHHLHVEIFCALIDVQLQELNERFDVFSNLQGIRDLEKALVEANLVETYALVYLLVKLTLILSVATANVERVFSSMKRTKNEVRNSIGDQYLNDCLVCYIECEAFEKIYKSVTARNHYKEEHNMDLVSKVPWQKYKLTEQPERNSGK